MFLFFCSTRHIEKFQKCLNNQNQDIRFTFKTEFENSILFLDITISRNNSKFTTSVYRKPTFGGVFTNFESFITKYYKYNLHFIMLHRALKLFSSFELLKITLKNNSYPKDSVDFYFKKYLDKVFIKKKWFWKILNNKLLAFFLLLEKNYCNWTLV